MIILSKSKPERRREKSRRTFCFLHMYEVSVILSEKKDLDLWNEETSCVCCLFAIALSAESQIDGERRVVFRIHCFNQSQLLALLDLTGSLPLQAGDCLVLPSWISRLHFFSFIILGVSCISIMSVSNQFEKPRDPQRRVAGPRNNNNYCICQ